MSGARRRRPAHRARLSRPRIAIRVPIPTTIVVLDEEDAQLDEEGEIHLSLRGLLKTMVASRPDAVDDHAGRVRCIRLRELAAALEATHEQVGMGDLADQLIAGLGGERLRQAYEAGDARFLACLDRELAARVA